MLATALQSRWPVYQAEEPAPGMLLPESPHVQAHNKLIRPRQSKKVSKR